MANYLIKPYVGFNNAEFGEERSVVRAKMGGYKEFRKTKFSKNTTDDFGDFHIYYDTDDIFEAVEFFEGEIFIGTTQLFPNSVSGLKTALEFSDNAGVSDESSITSKVLGVSGYVADDKIESIIAFRKGYYD